MKNRLLMASLLLALLSPAGAHASGQSPRAWDAHIPDAVLAQYETHSVGRYILHVKGRADLSNYAAIPDKAERRKAIVDALRTNATKAQADLIKSLKAGRRDGSVDSFTSFWITNAIAVKSTKGFLSAIARNDAVVSIAADTKRELFTEGGGNSNPTWNIEKVGADRAWDLGITGSGVVIGSLDTGVDVNHPAVQNGYRGIDGNHDYDWFDPSEGGATPYDDYGHGTHTMGTIAGGDGQGPDTNDIGVAPDATWIHAKVFDRWGSTTDSILYSGGQFMAAPTKVDGTDPHPELAPEAVSNSWGGGSCDPFYDEVLSNWRALDILPVFAIGNSGPGAGSANSPGDRPDAFSVGATNSADELAYFSSEGPACLGETKPEISAPGEDVPSSVPGGGYESYSGTSMATPHVVGTVALLQEASGGTLTIDELEELMTGTALDLGDSGADNSFGAGRLQVFDAVEQAIRGGKLLGTVKDANGDGIPGARVILSGPKNVQSTTSGDGTFKLRVPAGAYTMQVKAFGFLAQTRAVTIVESEDTLADFTLDLAPTYLLSGTVKEGPRLNPIAGASVRVLDTPLAPVMTDGSGAFQIAVPEGAYDVRTSVDGCRESDLTEVSIAAPTTLDPILHRVFDGYGYSCVTAGAPNEPGDTKLALPTGGPASAPVDLPFSFSFYGKSYDRIWPTSAGYASFSDEPVREVNTASPTEDAPNAAIYALWDGLSVRGSARGIYTKTYGTAPSRRFVIEYRNFEMPDTGDLLNFAIVLRENGTIDVRYRSLDGVGDGQSATVGIESPSGLTGFAHSVDEGGLPVGRSIRFLPGPMGLAKGTVLNAADGLPADGVIVETDGRKVVTQQDGTYRLAAKAGARSVTFSAPGYVSQTRTVTFVNGRTKTLNLSLDAAAASVDPAALSFSAATAPVSDDVTVSSNGTVPLDLRIAESTPNSGRIDDIPNDASDTDIESTMMTVADDAVHVEMGFSTPVDSNLFGDLFLDTDQNASTGAPPQDYGGLESQDIGADFIVNLWDAAYGYATIWDSTYSEYIGEVDVDVDGSTLTFDIPTSMIDDDGALDFAAALGSFQECNQNQVSCHRYTDWLPDAGHGTVGGYQDIGWLSSEGAAELINPGDADPFAVIADPSGMSQGDYLANIVLLTNDPRRLELPILVSFTVTDSTPPAVEFGGGPIVLGAVGEFLGGYAYDASGIQSVTVEFTNTLGGSHEVTAELFCDGGSACDFQVDAPETGSWIAIAAATDGAGNVGESGARQFITI